MRILGERSFPASALSLYASPRSAGRRVSTHLGELEVRELSGDALRGADIVFFAAGAATLVPHDDPAAFAHAARALLADPESWRRARRAGLAAAAAFSEDRAGAAAEEAMAWVAEGRWRAEISSKPPTELPGEPGLGLDR